MLEIIFQESTDALLHMLQTEVELHMLETSLINPNNDRFCVYDAFDVGYLDVSSIEERITSLKEIDAFDINAICLKKNYEQLYQALQQTDSIRIWTSSSSNEKMGTYFICLLLDAYINKDIDVYVCDASILNKDSTCLLEKPNDFLYLLQHEQKIDIHTYATFAKQYIHENSLLRINNKGTLQSVDITYFDETISSIHQQHPEYTVSQITNEVMYRCDQDENPIRYDVIFSRVRHLERKYNW